MNLVRGLLAVWLIAGVALPGVAREYQVFTVTELPGIDTHGYPATVYYLNQPDLVMGELGHYQPSGQQAAQTAALNRLASPEGKELLAILEHSFQGVLKAWAQKLDRLPALVIDDRYVLYGVYDLKEAETRLQNHLAQSGEIP